MEVSYQQCLIEKGNCSHIAWIPIKFAKQGKEIRIKQNGEWEEGFIVREVYTGPTISQEDVTEMDKQLKGFGPSIRHTRRFFP